MSISKKPSWVSVDLYKYIKSLLSRDIFAPPLALNAAMDTLFKDEEWWTFEYETILQSFIEWGLPLPSVHILGEIQCISAIRGGKALIDKEWHLFEKAVLSLTGIPVLFFDKQNVPIEYVHHATTIMLNLGNVEFSEEVLHYIGCEALNDEILWYPISSVDIEIVNAMGRIKSAVSADMDELLTLRDEVKAKFKEISDKDLGKIEFKNDSAVDMMCLTIYRSLLTGLDLRKVESEELSKCLSIRDGHSIYSEDGVSEIISVSDIPEVDDPTADVVYPEEVQEVSSIEDITSEVMSEKVSQVLDYMDKIGALPGVPIETGVHVGGQMQDTPGRLFKQIDSPPTAEASAEESMATLIKSTVTTSSSTEDSPFDL